MVSKDKSRNPKFWSPCATGTYEDAVFKSLEFRRHLEALGSYDGIGFLEFALNEGFTNLTVCSGAKNEIRDGRTVILNTEHAYVMTHPDGRRRVLASEPKVQDLARRTLEEPGNELIRTEYVNQIQFVRGSPHLTKNSLRTRLSRALAFYETL